MSIASATVLTLSPKARADEGGVPSGSRANTRALPQCPPPRAWSLPMQGYYYSGDASGSKSFPRGESVTLGPQKTTEGSQ